MAETATLMEDDEQRRRQLLSLAEKLFLQLVKLFLRHNIQLKELERVLRWAGIQVAARDPEFAFEDRDPGFKQSFSHVAVTTGLSRQEVSARIDDEHAQVDVSSTEINRLIRVLTAWRTEEGYQDESGHPLDIPLRGSPPSFHHLCAKYGRDTPTRPIADALIKNGNAEWIGALDNRSREKTLRYRHPVVTADTDVINNIAIFTQIGSDFFHSFQKMMDPSLEKRPRFREGYYCDIDPSLASAALAELHGEIQDFGVRCTELLKKYRVQNGEKVRIGVGAYSFEDAPIVLDETNGHEIDW